MRFGEAVHTVFIKKYFTFSGRASRSEFWWSSLFYLIILCSIFALTDFFSINVFIYPSVILGFNFGTAIDIFVEAFFSYQC